MGYSKGLAPSKGDWHGPSQPAVPDSERFGWVLVGLFAQAPLILAKYFCSRLVNRLTTARENRGNTGTGSKGDNR